jgi:hypothetical protein
VFNIGQSEGALSSRRVAVKLSRVSGAVKVAISKTRAIRSIRSIGKMSHAVVEFVDLRFEQ